MRLFILSIISLILFLSCESPVDNLSKNVTLDSFSSLRTKDIVIDSRKMYENINRNLSASDDMGVCRFLKKYYENSGPFIWVTRMGIHKEVDTLLSHIKRVDQIGFNKEKFYVSQIETDLKKVRDMNFENGQKIEAVIARLEGNLSKAYLCYVSGHRFGFVNPNRVLNYKNVEDENGCHREYEHKFDLAIERPDSAYYRYALIQADNGNLVKCIQESMPTNPLYNHLAERMKYVADDDTVYRYKYIANMERLRWRLKDAPEMHERYILVNIPSFKLWSVCPDSILSMRIVCGAIKTKSPILNSRIKRIDLNPRWLVPPSIAKKSLANVGYIYFQRNNMYFIDSSGKKLSYASPEMRKKGLVSIVQQGGNGNSLGRIIFRFDNKFSVYLHHTNTPWAFSASDRALSHGCIRVERPYDLACFLHPQDENLHEKIRYSITCDLSNPDSTMLIRSVKIDPEIPVYIFYYTLFIPPRSEELVELDDIYGYDKDIYHGLTSWIYLSNPNSIRKSDK